MGKFFFFSGGEGFGERKCGVVCTGWDENEALDLEREFGFRVLRRIFSAWKRDEYSRIGVEMSRHRPRGIGSKNQIYDTIGGLGVRKI